MTACIGEGSKRERGGGRFSEGERKGERSRGVGELQNAILNFIATVVGILKLIRFSCTILIIESVI